MCYVGVVYQFAALFGYPQPDQKIKPHRGPEFQGLAPALEIGCGFAQTLQVFRPCDDLLPGFSFDLPSLAVSFSSLFLSSVFKVSSFPEVMLCVQPYLPLPSVALEDPRCQAGSVVRGELSEEHLDAVGIQQGEFAILRKWIQSFVAIVLVDGQKELVILRRYLHESM